MKFNIEDLIVKFKYDPNSVKENYDGKTDVYLAKVSYRYAYFRRILAVLLLIVIIAFLLSGNIAYNKFYYLVKDVKLASDYVNSVHDTITYNSGNSQSFATYRSGLAVASRERFSIFAAGGRELYFSNHSYGNPALASSDKYVLLYDVGGKQFSLYNSFSKLESDTLDYAIYGAAIAKNGTFALVTKSEKYDSVVSLRRQNGTKYDYNFASGLVCAVDLSENGTSLAVLLTFAEGNSVRNELRLYKVGSKDYKSVSISFSGIPYAVKIMDNGNVLVVGANGVNAFSSGLNLLGEYLTDDEIYLYYLGEDNIAVSHLSEKGSKTKVVLLNKRGRTEKEFTFNERLLDIALCDDYLFVQKLGCFERINTVLNTSSKMDVVATDFKMIVSDKNTLIICNYSYARFINFDK